MAAAITRPGSAAKIDHRRRRIVRIRLINDRRSIASKDERTHADLYTHLRGCGRRCRKCESGKDNREFSLLHNGSLECSGAAKVTARVIAELQFIACVTFFSACPRCANTSSASFFWSSDIEEYNGPKAAASFLTLSTWACAISP